jgi:hypothetical protein
MYAHLRYIHLRTFIDMHMDRKTETLNLRVSPELKELVRVAAGRDHRTIANFIEMLVREHCEREQIAVGQELEKRSTSR